MKEIYKKNYTKIGILGGTFDPPHKGHLYISQVAIKKFKLKKILWIVTKKNPLKKKPYLSKNIRIKLSKQITKNKKKIFVKYFDDKIKTSNTFTLLNYIKKNNKKSKLFFLIGADNLLKFHKWYNWKKITEMVQIVVFPRKNFSYRNLSLSVHKKLNKKDFIYVNCKKINISSSLIRKLW